MTVQYLIALSLACFASFILGRKCIPWLEKHEMRQVTKEEVETQIYSEDKRA